MINNKEVVVIATVISALTWSGLSSADSEHKKSKVVIDLPVSTQGPLWPPSETVNEDGDFVLVGNALTEVAPGVIAMVPEQALLVSKETIPPLDENGVEDPDNWFGAAYKIIRPLNLSEGSEDLNTVLYANSFGPAVGSGNSPRIPALGDSTYNLNGDFAVCKDTFPTMVQDTNYFRSYYPLHQAPIAGFQGDGVAYDATTGQPYDPMTASDDPACAGTGCNGEDAVDQRSTKPITLGDWLKAKGKVTINLTKPNSEGQHTHAKFKFKLRNMLPNSVYTVWVVRGRQIPIPGVWNRRDIDPMAMPNIIVTDEKGNASEEFEMANPFPDPASDFQRMRVFGLSIVYHSDFQTWGGCFARLGPGVDVHAVFNTLNSEPPVPGGLPSLTDLITVSP